jgi:hypothetical protein
MAVAKVDLYLACSIDGAPVLQARLRVSTFTNGQRRSGTGHYNGA